MPPLHPANNTHARLAIHLWRFFSGNHLDGRARTNATWLKRGTAPSHHVNWWNAKPRFHRMIWRWGMIGIPMLWIIAYSISPSFDINLIVILSLCVIPYLFHHGVLWALHLIPRHRVIFVQDNVPSEMVDTDLDDIGIPEQLPQDNIQELLDAAIEGDVDAPPRKRRSS